MSLMKTVVCVPSELLTDLTGMLLIASTCVGLPFRRTWYSCMPIFTVPAGRIRFWSPIAPEMSDALMPQAYIFSGSISTMTARILPPYGYGICTPGMLIRLGRMALKAKSNMLCSGSVSLDSDSCSTGTSLALYCRINGGCVPAGNCRSAVWAMAVICALASAMSAPG